jgi:hypothetical protein
MQALDVMRNTIENSKELNAEQKERLLNTIDSHKKAVDPKNILPSYLGDKINKKFSDPEDIQIMQNLTDHFYRALNIDKELHDNFISYMKKGKDKATKKEADAFSKALRVMARTFRQEKVPRAASEMFRSLLKDIIEQKC